MITHPGARWRSKPPHGTPVNRSHPLAPDLGYYPFDGTLNNPVRPAEFAAFEGTAANIGWQPGSSGLAVQHLATDGGTDVVLSQTVTPYDFDRTTPFSFELWYVPSGTGRMIAFGNYFNSGS